LNVYASGVRQEMKASRAIKHVRVNKKIQKANSFWFRKYYEGDSVRYYIHDIL